jgi:Putative DNA-binding domain
MSTFDIPIKEITPEVLQSLVDNQIREDLQLEYKEALPNAGGRDKFLKSIAAFANTSGGDLIFGVKAKRDENGTPTGEPEDIVGLGGIVLDQEKLRLEQWIRMCIEPTPGFRIEVIDRGDKPPCLLVRVLSSWLGLHIIKTLDNPFYGCHSGGKFPLSLAEIRAGFLQGETARDRIRRFREERVNRILLGKTPANVGGGPKVIFHAFPLRLDEDSWVRFRVAEHDTQSQQGTVPLFLRVALLKRVPQNYHYNTDGFVVETLEEQRNYTQVFRDCGIEAVGVDLIRLENPQRKIFYGLNIEKAVINALDSYGKIWTQLGITGPIALFLTLTGIKDFRIAARYDPWQDDLTLIDRDHVITQDILLEQLSDPPDRILKPLFDFMWNAGGYSQSPFYENGSWIGDQGRS